MWLPLRALYDIYFKKVLDRIKERNDTWSKYTVDDEGFTQTTGDDEGKSFAWKDVQHVGILTTSDGPFFEDVFYIIQLNDKNICLTQSQATEMELLDHFSKLPGFRWEGVIEAMGSTSEAAFHCWDVSWSH